MSSSDDGTPRYLERQRPTFVEIHEEDQSVLVEAFDPDGERTRKPLKLSCTVSRCNDELHCFRTSRKRTTPGACRDCGRDDLVDWERLRKRNIEQAPFVFDELEKEMVRHIYWHVPFDPHAINKAKRKGRIGIYGGIGARIHQAIGGEKHPMEGRQTKWIGDVYYYAQHATASCCRRCVEYRHGIKPGVPLTAEEENYLGALVKRYLDLRLLEQIPDLQDLGQKVAAIRSAAPQT